MKQKKKGRFWKGLGLTCLITIGAGAAYGTLTPQGRDTTAVIRQYTIPIIAAHQNPDLLFEDAGQDHVNILLVGVDRNWKQGKVFDPPTGKYRPHQVIDNDTRPRSDTLIVCSLDKITQTMRLISLPRDTRVRYRDLNGVKHSATKLNSLWAEKDGDQLLTHVLQDEFGLRIDRVAQIKLDGFTKLIDRVGGITINVEGAKFGNKRTRMKYEDKWGGWKVDLEPGMQTLDGEQAHGYVRFRMDNEGDPGRVRRQQQVMRALAKKMTSVGPLQLPGLVKELQNLFVTSMSDEETVSAAMFAHGLSSPAQIAPLTPYGIYAENGDIILNRPENEKLFTAIFGSSFDPKKFLILSPETKRDDIGARNNDNPAALSVLREAGLLEEEKLVKRDAKLEAPGLQDN